MINNDSLTQALGTLERYAPAEDEVLAGMRTGIQRRRRRHQVASVAGAGAAGLVALGVVYVAPSRDAGPSEVAGGSTPTSTSALKIATPPAPPTLPVTVGWVPEGWRLDSWQAGRAEASAQYTGGKDFQTIVVWVSADPRPAMTAGDTEEPTTIAGRSGVIRRLAPDAKETQLIWQLEDGRWVMVGGRAPTVQLATLRRVADSLSTKPTPLPASFSLTTMPDGYQVATWMGGNTLSGLTICRSEYSPRTGPQPADCLNVSVQAGTAPTVTYDKVAAKPSEVVEVPLNQEKTIGGLLTRATPDGTRVVAQVDPGHWVQVFSAGAGVELLRQVAATARS